MGDMSTLGIRKVFIERAEEFLRRHGWTQRQLALAIGDHKFFMRLRNGHGYTLSTLERAEELMQTVDAGATLAALADRRIPPHNN